MSIVTLIRNTSPVHTQVIGAAPQIVTVLGVSGLQGLSAYEIAQRNGFVGTEAQWLESLGSAPAPASDIYLPWVLSLQNVNPSSPAYGAILRHDSAATYVGSEPFFCIEPYFASLAAFYALEADASRSKDFAARWINWWAAHRNSVTQTALVTYVNASGSVLATALPGANPAVQADAEDAVDSNHAMWFLCLSKYISLFGLADLRSDIATHAGEAFDYWSGPEVRDTDDLTWALPAWHVKYLMDNVEVFAGLQAAQAVFKLLGDETRSTASGAWLIKIGPQIASDMWDSATDLWAPSKGSVANIALAYPDALAQVWPGLFGLDKARGGYATFVNHWPAWELGSVAAAGGSADAAVALAAVRAGDIERARSWLVACAAARSTPTGFEWPMTCADVAMAAVVARAVTQGVIPVGVPGPTGAPGATGQGGKDGQIRFTGHGAPGVIVGAEPGDTYLDLLSGEVYKLM